MLAFVSWSWWPRGPFHAAVIGFCVSIVAGVLTAWLGVGISFFVDGHIELADSLVHGLGYRFSAHEPRVLHRPPLYPLLITVVAALPNAGWRAGLTVLHSLLVAAASAQTFLIGRRWFGATIAGWGVMVFVCNPWMASVLRTTRTSFLEIPLYLALCAWFLEWAARDAERPTWQRAALFGAVGGLLTLTHASKLLTALLLIGVLVAVFLARRQWRASVTMAFAVLAMALVIAPWTYRNYVVSGRFVPVATNAGFAYFAGNARWGINGPLASQRTREDESWQRLALVNAGVTARPDDVGRFWGVYSPDLNELLDRRMKAHIVGRPVDFLRKLACNGVAAYLPVAHHIYAHAHAGNEKVTRASFNDMTWSAAMVVLWVAALAGLARGSAAGDQRAAWWMLALVGAFVVAYLPFLVLSGPCGYVLPTLPLLALLAARCRAYWPMPEAGTGDAEPSVGRGIARSWSLRPKLATRRALARRESPTAAP